MNNVEKQGMEKSAAMGLSKISLRNETSKQDVFVNYVVWQVRGRTVIEYKKIDYEKYHQSDIFLESIKQKKNTYQGEMTIGAQRRMKRILTCWSHAIQLHNSGLREWEMSDRRRIVFVTLTLSSSQFHSDQKIKSQVLKPFMRILRECYEVENYVWKAERQENGNIHFHVIIDRYVKKEIIQEKWNECQNKLGYIDKFRHKFGNENAPSTKIEVAKDSEDVMKYLIKYVIKHESGRPIEGAVWKASKKLNSLQYFEIERDNFMNKRSQVAAVAGNIEFIVANDCNVIKLKDNDLEGFLSYSALSFWKCYCSVLRTYVMYSTRFDSFPAAYESEMIDCNLRKINSQHFDVLAVKAEKIRAIQLKLFDIKAKRKQDIER